MNVGEVKLFFEKQRHALTDDEYAFLMLIMDKVEKSYVQRKERALAYKNQGNEVYRSGDFESAIELYSLAIEADPSNAVFYSNRAAAFAQLNKTKEAIEDCLCGVKIDPTFIKFYVRLGTLYRDTDKDKAAYWYEKGLEIDPDSEAVKRHIAELNKKNNSFNLEELMHNSEVASMVQNLVKDKSPEELASMVKGFMNNMQGQ